MDVFSLEEEDDYGGLFLTQSGSVKEVQNDVDMQESDEFLGLPTTDFQSPCASILNIGDNLVPCYSDISDDEFMPNSSQIQQKDAQFE